MTKPEDARTLDATWTTAKFDRSQIQIAGLGVESLGDPCGSPDPCAEGYSGCVIQTIRLIPVAPQGLGFDDDLANVLNLILPEENP